MYSVMIDLPTGVGFGRAGLPNIGAVLDYVRGALRPSPSRPHPLPETVTIDGPSADKGTYRVGPDRKLYRVRP